MSRKKSADSGSPMLVNKLTVRDAEHLVKFEGGSLTPPQLAFRVGATLLVAAFAARAILVGQATAWHLFLPMVGEYLVILIALPLLALFLHDKNLRTDAWRSLRWIGILAGIFSLWIASRSFDEGTAWAAQARTELSRFLTWITTHQMHWPILGAMAAMAAGLPGRVASFRRHGPPFMAAGLGCAMRLLLPLFGCFLLPVIAAGKLPIVWLIWTILLLSELGALYMHWDLQRRLARRGIVV